MVISVVDPKSIGILTTMKCTAACQECCFECSPNRKERITFTEIKKIIDSIVIAFPTIKVVAWTGGECTLLGDDLINGISYAKGKGILSRIVSNGWWATSDEKAFMLLKKLKEAGLDEVNISTGDNHQEFVPEDIAIRAAVTAAELGISTIISVEKRGNAKFKKEDIFKNKIFQKFADKNINTDLLKIIDPVWVSFHSDNIYDYGELNLSNNLGGCDSIFETLLVSKNNEVALCCGLSLDYIPSLVFDDIQSMCDKPENTRLKFYNTFNDFLKIWIYVEGPYKILQKVQKWDSNIEVPNFIHQCLYCSYLYNNIDVQKVISEHYKEVQNKVMEKFYNKAKWKKISVNII